MKLLHLLLSLCLAFLLCSVPLIQAQSVPTIATAAPTPPNGAPGADSGEDAPPMPSMLTTVNVPTIDTTYGDYAGSA
ncbi:uncharacterized protein LOC115759576 [Drosophila novamexicana]|uniref:uncharacterized protein LOC115759576 n=1 Tax=Drosophila novamexicana TaxID=47314 RepID=UPI0011E5FF88|nr:uncharacterized protein LOC115759576 [Drosophila novamexicana]